MPTSIGKLKGLTDLKLELNIMSGDLPRDIMNWPIFKSNTTSTSILTGNVWGCPVPDEIRDHSNDDPTHTYLCGNDPYMIPLLLLGAAFALFYFASNNASTNPELRTLVRKREGVESNRTSRVFDHIALVNVARGMVIFVGILAVAMTALGYTFWYADSPFGKQPSIWKASFTMKSSSDELVISVLIITTLTLVVFL